MVAHMSVVGFRMPSMFGVPFSKSRQRHARCTPRAVADAALEFLLPTRCAGCGDGGGPCCVVCGRALGMAQRRSPPLLPSTPAYALATHRGVARELVLQHKERGRRDLTEPLGAAFARELPLLPDAGPDRDGTWWLVPAPSRSAAARVRGGSHTRALATACAARLAESGQPSALAPALRLRGGGSDMTGLGREQRARNLVGRVTTVAAGLPAPGSTVVLLDDVLTTGATAAACVRALRAAGCSVCAVLTLTAAC